MTSGRLSNTENLPLFGAALVAMYAIYAALSRLPRRLARWVRGVFTAPLHKAPRGHAEQHERVPSPVFRSAFADRAGHETHAWPPGSLTSPWPAQGGPPWSPQAEPQHPAATMVPLYGAGDAPSPNVPGPDGVGTGGKRAADPVTAGPGTLLPEIAADLNGHTSTGDALDSMLQRALSPELLARLDAQKGARDG